MEAGYNDIRGTTAIALALGVSQQRLVRLLGEGRIVGARMVRGVWQAPSPLTVIERSRPMRHTEGVIYISAPVMPPLPAGTFRCHVVDPPWPIAKIPRKVRPNQKQM